MMIKRICCFLLAFLFFGSFSIKASKKGDVVIMKRIDSLKLSLSRSASLVERLHVLYDLSACYRDEQEECDYCMMLYSEASKVDSIFLKEYAAATLTRYYYNKNLMDSVVYWSGQVKRIAQERGSYSDRYFFVCNLACQFILWYDVNEEGANEAIRLYHLAQKEKNKTGIYSCCQTMGVAYVVMGQDSIAISYYEEGIRTVQSIQPLHYSIMQSMMESLLEAALRLQRLDLVEKYLMQYENLTEDIAKGKYGEDKYPIDRCRWLADCFRSDYYILRNNLEEARRYIGKASEYASSVDDIYVKYRFHLSCVYYYKAKHEYITALAHMDEVLKLGDSTELFILKGEILMQEGRDREAAECYRLAIHKTKEKADASFMRQMTQLAHLHDISQETQAHNEEILKRKQWQLIMLLSSACFFMALLVVVVIYTLRVRRMRNKMRIERDRLMESENRLSLARDKAVESDRLKSLFLANMSHEIRTPLNAIVGFSQLLCSPEDIEVSEDERKSFSDLILRNSDLLLNLINDILDVSKLEANSYHFNFGECDVNECCHTCLESVRHRVASGVRLTFTPPQEHFLLNTDKLRLEQVLMNLLTNAAKFTEQGEINVSYQPDEESGYVCFSVTDTGCGVPEDKQKVIFNRFEKLNDYVQGTGLGLAICALIVKQFGGTVKVDGNYRQGARFVFTHRL
ncbi:HAMP domain-containing sensor histidine kinase [Bacteroides helcogenes]|uniref:ATP-binding protein n=1 Tax=Bacteroides helcogenes TaxID=290053 RepID=UPI002A911571|nr:HAMP domain-containing sensor histidine kinase [Bacteroides helcogenes]MDY5239393.1 HAMP domain-containing sensor histidine kinase [Bacteroides helcogenes]